MAKIMVGRLDNNKTVEIVPGSILDAFRQAGYNKADNEEIQDITGNKYTGSEPCVDGKGYFFVERVKSGN